MTPRAALLLAVMAAVGWAGLTGYRHGVAAVEARHAAAVAELRQEMAAIAAETDKAEAARLEAERERDALREQLDEAAAADPDAGRRAVSAGGMQRIGTVGR